MLDEQVTAEELLEAALAKLRAAEVALQDEYASQIAVLRHKIAAVESALSAQTTPHNASRAAEAALSPRAEPQPLLLPVAIDHWQGALKGLSQSQAVIRIAEEQGGELRVPDARRILITAGLVRGAAKNVSSHIYHMINESGRFERVGPGTFRLLPADGVADESDESSKNSIVDHPADASPVVTA